MLYWFFFFQAEDGIRDGHVTGVQTCALPICLGIGRLGGGLDQLGLGVGGAGGGLLGGRGIGGGCLGGSGCLRGDRLLSGSILLLDLGLREQLALPLGQRLGVDGGDVLLPRSEERRVGKEGS